jgi:hypothetical protein
VEWKQTLFGAGLFAAEDIVDGTLLRTGIIGINLVQFRSINEIETFCKGPDQKDDNENEVMYKSRLNYVKDYLWGYNPNADERGYDVYADKEERIRSPEHDAARFFGMWVPGNGLNHNPSPNTVYRPSSNGGMDVGIDLIALRDIKKGEELFDDYSRHGNAPTWLLEFASKYNVTLNFAECNNFVDTPGGK